MITARNNFYLAVFIKLLRQNIAQNIAQNNFKDIECINKAVWSEDTTLSFKSDNSDGGRVEKGAGGEVQAMRLSSLLPAKVDFLKIDIEGSELVVLNEIQEHLHKIDRIFIEFHSFIGKDQKLAELLRLLEINAFRYYISTPGISSKKPFIHKPNYMGMDMQLNIFAENINNT